jgi:hypothetical protein
VHRLQQALDRRNVHPESWLLETEEVRHWLTRLVVATLYAFGFKCGVGMDTMREFFARLRQSTPKRKARSTLLFVGSTPYWVKKLRGSPPPVVGGGQTVRRRPAGRATAPSTCTGMHTRRAMLRPWVGSGP